MPNFRIVALFFLTLHFSKTVSAQEEQAVWLDSMHKNISESVLDTAQWFDNFFANENLQEDQKALGEVRLRLGIEPRSRSLEEFEARLKVRVKLPNLKNRVDLILTDFDEDQDDKIGSSGNSQFNREDSINLALRYKVSPDSGLSHRIGFGRRFQYYAKSRYRDALSLSNSLEMRYDASIYYYNRDKFGTSLSLTFDYDYSKHLLLRYHNRFEYRDRSNDWLWQHSWQGFKQINDTSAVIYGYYIEGITQPNYRLEEHLVSVKLRKQTKRNWLFYEVEPFILWRRNEHFSASYGLALRIEGYFGER
ncbi:MAG: hypothetical protein ABJV04_09350 [Aliiglaciecola sp.]|uniref:hypothetical protein n=1 Tax=Aliiglaciecola sp. TaxID=1872441 RepID=UPI0032969170